MTVYFNPEELRSLERALASLQAEQAVLERNRMHSVDLQLAIDDITLLRDRMQTEMQELRASLASRTSFPTLRAVS